MQMELKLLISWLGDRELPLNYQSSMSPIVIPQVLISRKRQRRVS
jgi:hypothetical protein